MKKPLSIKIKMLSITTLTVFILGSVSIFFVFNRISSILLTKGEESIQSIINSKTYDIELVIENNKKIASSLSKKTEIIDYLDSENPETQDPEILKILSNYKGDEIFSAVYLLDRQGKAIASTDEASLGVNFSFRDYFKNSILGKSYVDVAIGATTKELGYYFSYPIIGNNKTIKGVAVMKAKPSVIEQFAHEKINDNISDVMITDDKGLILFSKKTNRIFKTLGPLTEEEINFEKTKRFADITIESLSYGIIQKELKNIENSKTFEILDSHDKEEELVFVAKIKNSPLFIMIEIEKDKFTSSLGNLAQEISLIGFFTLLFLVFIIVYVVATQINNPLEHIEDYAISLSDNDFDAKINLNKSTSKEFVKIAVVLQKMAKKLQESKERTNKKIKEQTKKISINTKDIETKQEALINVLEDIEDEKELSEKLASDLQKFKLATDHATDLIFITNPKGVLLYANKAVEHITGYKQKYILDEKNKKNWFTIIFNKNVFHSAMNRINEKKESTYKELSIKTKEKFNRVLGLRMSPIVNDNKEIIFLVGIGRDITAEKEIDKSKTEFVSVASHQLRTPLSTINWYTELLLSEDTGHLSKEQEEYVSEIRRDTKQMTALVESLLNVSRIDMGTVAVEPEKVSLTKIAESAIKEFRPRMEKHKFKFTKHFDEKLPKTLLLDKQLTFMIFQNLISNAVKYTPDKGKITLNIKKRDKDIEIIVSDSGIGIPRKDQDKIFNKLFRGSNAKTKHVTGVGLGLYIIKSFMEKVGGKIWFKSELKKGTTFYVTIPLKGMKKIKGTTDII